MAFSRARDAVATAVAAQQALMKHPWPDGESLQVRMGLHTGEPISTTDRYVGLDVHRAARIGATGHGGQILLSDSVRALVAVDLPPGVALRDLGTHRLKDLRAPERLFQVVHLDLPTDFPPLKSLDVRHNNLPRQLTSFIGREREMAELNHLLSTAYLVTLTGSGGAGKTRLALRVAAMWRLQRLNRIEAGVLAWPRTSRCPECGSSDVVPTIYGYPTQEAGWLPFYSRPPFTYNVPCPPPPRSSPAWPLMLSRTSDRSLGPLCRTARTDLP